MPVLKNIPFILCTKTLRQVDNNW